MALYANGTLIPQNVANALMVNGVSITQVIANGITVWTQSLLPLYTAGTAYLLAQLYGSGNYNSWTTIGTRTFKGSSGSVVSIRAMARGNNVDWEYVYTGYGRVLVNGEQVAYIGSSADMVWRYSAFVNRTLNYGDVITFQGYTDLQYWNYYPATYHTYGGGQIYSNLGTAGYFV